jgi:2',3'-cyclic-nucleotide 2'-phosphodiesterase (5'-nucleotidase family)
VPPPPTSLTHSSLIKSGTDFRDLTSAYLELSAPNDKAVRRRVVTSLTGKHNYVTPSSPSLPAVDDLVSGLLATVNRTLHQPVCYTLTPFDARSEVVRTRESGLGNWAADVLLHAYDESLVEGNAQVSFDKDKERTPEADGQGADAVIICGGTLRGDSQYGPGKVTLGDILEIFPFDDAVVCMEIDGKGIWSAIENGLSRWPAQEGRFPVIAGLAVEWDSRRAPGNRILSIHLTVPKRQYAEDEDPNELVDFVDNEDGTRVEIKQRHLVLGDEVKNEEGGRIYRVVSSRPLYLD